METVPCDAGHSIIFHSQYAVSLSGGSRGRDRMVVEFIISYAINAHHH